MVQELSKHISLVFQLQMNITYGRFVNAPLEANSAWKGLSSVPIWWRKEPLRLDLVALLDEKRRSRSVSFRLPVAKIHHNLTSPYIK
jgi:hypothetical protein